MASCTFFGHRDCGENIKQDLLCAIEQLVEEGVTTFYVGTHGNFDIISLNALREIKRKHSHITYTVVLAYMPKEAFNTYWKPEETLYPDGVEKAPKRFAISYRNEWMLRNSDYVIAYVTRTYGGAADFVKKVISRGKKVIHLAENQAEQRK
jgi:uncharacterized phage-like protein YoqJ